MRLFYCPDCRFASTIKSDATMCMPIQLYLIYTWPFESDWRNVRKRRIYCPLYGDAYRSPYHQTPSRFFIEWLPNLTEYYKQAKTTYWCFPCGSPRPRTLNGDQSALPLLQSTGDIRLRVRWLPAVLRGASSAVQLAHRNYLAYKPSQENVIRPVDVIWKTSGIMQACSK